MALGWLWWRAWGVAAAVCMAGVALGDIDFHFAWQAWHLVTSTFTLRQGWHLATSTCILHGRRGTSGTALALARLGTLVAAAVCLAGVALGDIDLHFAWQAWHLVTLTFTLRQGWHLATSTCILHGRRGTSGTALALARLGTLVAAAVCLAGVALGDIDLHFAWQAWHLVTSTFNLRQGWHLATSTCILHGRRGTSGTALAPVARLGTLVTAAVCLAGVALGDIDLHFAWQAWHLWHWTGSGGTQNSSTQLCHRFLSHTTLSDKPFTHNFVTPNSFTHNFVTHKSFTHNSFTHNFVTYISFTRNLLHTTLSHTTLSHTTLLHTQTYTHNTVTHSSFTQPVLHDLLSFLPFPSHFHICL